jgi:hypothetical protein
MRPRWWRAIAPILSRGTTIVASASRSCGGWTSPERDRRWRALPRTWQGLCAPYHRTRVRGETDTHRLWLGAFPDNARARRAYEQVGFCPEGIARGSAFFGGVFGDELIMTILRPEWEGGLLSTR